MSRRKFLGLTGAIAVGGTIGAGLASLAANSLLGSKVPPSEGPPSTEPTLTPIPTEQLKSPEIQGHDIEFGFNTHLDNEAQNMNLELFKKCVEDLSTNGQNWIRFNLNNNDPEVLSDFDQGLEFAKQKGLKIALVTNPPDVGNAQSIADYYATLSERFKGKIDVWQIFNEANAHDFRNYGQKPTLSPDYLREFSLAVEAASAAIKQVDPSSKVTVNMSDWVGDHRDIVDEGSALFSSVLQSIDLLTLDLYPDNNEEEISRYPQYIEALKNVIGKDVMIGEIGWPTYDNGFTPVDQAKYMAKVASVLAGGSVKPIAVLFYEWANEEGVGENAFGAMDTNGNPKDNISYQSLIQAMKPQESLAQSSPSPQG